MPDNFSLTENDRMRLSRQARGMTREHYENILKYIAIVETEDFYVFGLRFACHEWLTYNES